MAVSEDQIRWYSKQDYKVTQEETKMEPTALISAGAIVLNKEAAGLFADGDSIMIGTSKRGARKVLLRTAQGSDPYTPFQAKQTAGGGVSIRCRPFVQDVLVGDYGMEFPDRKRARFAVTVDEENKRVVVSLKALED